jgi:hypothetical protein
VVEFEAGVLLVSVVRVREGLHLLLAALAQPSVGQAVSTRSCGCCTCLHFHMLDWWAVLYCLALLLTVLLAQLPTWHCCWVVNLHCCWCALPSPAGSI